MVTEKAWNSHLCPGAPCSEGRGVNFRKGEGGMVQRENLIISPHPRDVGQRVPVRDPPETYQRVQEKETILVEIRAGLEKVKAFSVVRIKSAFISTQEM